MRTVCQASAADSSYFLAPVNMSAALRQNRRDEAKVAVNANESVVLDQDFQTSDSMSLNSDDGPGGDGDDLAADVRRQINPIVECPGKWAVGKDTRPERR